ncbi:unnamed protein product [Pleuronectes platessa]|uniref:Phosphoinositide phospholipase C n=1 Tax=Pleuronectes platessa TaxID=8262 RepID=A0A9N7YP32_PLEPL|nr:unnamed protein product [Pleuronectes platessa]
MLPHVAPDELWDMLFGYRGSGEVWNQRKQSSVIVERPLRAHLRAPRCVKGGSGDRTLAQWSCSQCSGWCRVFLISCSSQSVGYAGGDLLWWLTALSQHWESGGFEHNTGLVSLLIEADRVSALANERAQPGSPLRKRSCTNPRLPPDTCTAQTCGKSPATSSREPGKKVAEKTMDPIRKLGLLDNEDIHLMMKGSSMVKIRSQRWQKSRNLRLLEDGLTVWCESTKSSRKAKAQQTFAVTEVECVREGCQSEALRRVSGSVPDSRCFTVVFRGARKSLDLLCPGYLRRADQNQDGKMSYDEVKRLLQMINIDLSEHYARSLFKRCDRSGDNRLDHKEIEEFCRELMRRPELDGVFRHYSSNGCVLSTAELRDFLGDQGEDASLNHAQSLILTYELNDWAQKNQFMTQNGFTMYMLSLENDVVNPIHARVYQDMSHPLSHYFISSSHNTYLTKDQVTGASSTEPYIRALNQGCRCVELDCWDGDKGEPVIYHGHTLTSKVSFKEVIETIAQYGFKASPYPLILSLENHCSVEQQAVMAKHLRTILGSKLLTKPLSDNPLKDLPSPEDLKGHILVKGKKHIPHIGQLGKTGSCASFSSSSEDELAISNKNTPKEGSHKGLF